MALYDNVFAAEFLKNVSNIFRAKVSAEKKCLLLKMKRTVLNIPVFREPERAVNEYHISPIKSLKSST